MLETKEVSKTVSDLMEKVDLPNDRLLGFCLLIIGDSSSVQLSGSGGTSANDLLMTEVSIHLASLTEDYVNKYHMAIHVVDALNKINASEEASRLAAKGYGQALKSKNCAAMIVELIRSLEEGPIEEVQH